MTGGQRFQFKRMARSILILALSLATLWIGPLPQAAQAAAAGAQTSAPAAAPQPAAAAQPAAIASPLGPLPSPTPTMLVTTSAVADDPNDGKCDLWEAMQAAFQAQADLSPSYHECTAALGGTNVIGFSPAVLGGTILVPDNVGSGELPFAAGDLTILGPITLKPSTVNTDTHTLIMGVDATLTLIAVTLSGGHTSGGGAAILDFNHSTVNLIGSNVTGNVADNDGGAINSNGNVNVTLSNFSGNQALGLNNDGNGGAIAIEGAGSLSVSKSNFAGNSAKYGGGAIYSLSQNATIEDSLFSGNIGGQGTDPDNAGGGAIYNFGNGAMGIARTQFAGNLSPQGHGGAIFNTGAGLLITDTTFALNLAGTFSNAFLGGALYDRTSLTVYRSSFVNNVAVSGDGGGLVVDRHGSVDVANSTFALNGAPSGVGAGLVVTQTQIGGPASSLTLQNDTIAANGTLAQHDAGIFNDAGNNLTLGNTLLSSNLNGNCAGLGALTNLGHNLDSGTSCNLPGGTGNISNGSANLGGPSFNGGPLSTMLTMKLQRPSDAIDHGDNAICAADPVDNLDQRSNKRPVDGTLPGNLNPVCDIGAYEADGPSPSFGSSPSEPGPIDVGNVQTGHLVQTTLVVSNTGDFALGIQNIALTGSNPGDFSVPNAPIVINPGTSPVNITIGCTPSAVGQRTAILGFATTDVPTHAAVAFELKCTGNAVPTAGFGASPIPPGPITFADTIFNTTSTKTIQVTDAGNAALTVSHNPLGGANPGDFSVSSDSFSLNPGDPAHTITVHCTPQDYGLRTATLTLSTNDGTQPSVVYNLSCKGIPTPSPDFGPGTSIGNSPDHGLAGAFGVAVSPSGAYVYSAGNTDGKVGSFARNPLSGALSFLTWIHDGFFHALDSAIQIAVSPDGKNAYVTAQAFNTLDVLTVDPSHPGQMSFSNYQITNPPQLAGAHGVAVSPDGRSVYATGYISNSVVAFSRNLSDGHLTFKQAIIANPGLHGAEGLAVSPDGQNVYVAAGPDSTHGSLDVFKRNPTDSTLTHVQTNLQSDTNLSGLAGAYQVSVSPDGQNVYVAATGTNAIVAFTRNPADGSLQWLATYVNGTGGIDGMNGPLGIDTTPDGLHVIASGFSEASVAVFDRDPANGFLTFNSKVQRDINGNPPLNGALEVRVSPDGHNVYVAAYADNAIAVLQAIDPVPLLTNFSPASANQGGPAFTLRVFGASFVPNSKVLFGQYQPSTTYVSPYELDATITSAMIASAGNPVIQIDTVEPAGGDQFSFPKNFVVEPTASPHNPVPSITNITPQGQLSGGSGLTLDVYGAGFINGSTVRWNGANRATTFVNSGHLQVAIAQSDVSQPGVSSVTVFTGGPGGGTSNAVSFTVAQPGNNAVPSLTSINPVWVFSHGAASKDLQMTITGQNFIQGSVGQLNGLSLPTVFVDSSHLKVTVTGSNLAVPASKAITVLTHGPGGGASNPITFIIRKLYQLFAALVRR